MRAWILLQTVLHASVRTSLGLFRVSVPEGHQIILNCNSQSWRGTAHLVWTHGDNRVVARMDWNIAPKNNKKKHLLLMNGSLQVSKLQPSDSGEYHCNEQAVAHVEVLTGLDYSVSAGRTVLLPCKFSDKQKQKWMFRKDKYFKRKSISVRFKNGTVVKDIDDPQNRFIQTNNELKIINFQPMDAGEYFCNTVQIANVTVRTETTDNDTEPKTVLTSVIIVLSMLTLVAPVAGLFLWIRLRNGGQGEQRGEKKEGPRVPAERSQDMGRTRERHAQRAECHFLENERNAEEVPHEEGNEIHYVSLGHQKWRERPFARDREHYVVYSTVAGRTVI